jgi:hypothetical protein
MMDDRASDIPEIDYRTLSETLEAASACDDELFRAIVNAPFAHPVHTTFMFLAFVVLCQVDKKARTIRRVAYSRTPLAYDISKVSNLPFDDLHIPLDHDKNLISKAIRTGKPHDTTDWSMLLTPPLSKAQARVNQAGGGIAYSVVYPLKSRGGGELTYSFFQYPQNIGEAQREFMERYTTLIDKALSTGQPQAVSQ